MLFLAALSALRQQSHFGWQRILPAYFKHWLLGLAFLISSYPHIAHVMKYLGIIFILYLAFKFFKMSNTLKKPISPLTFKDGVMVDMLCVTALWLFISCFTVLFALYPKVGRRRPRLAADWIVCARSIRPSAAHRDGFALPKNTKLSDRDT